MAKIRTCDLIRHLPDWAKVVKTVNETQIYNMNVFENVMSWNQERDTSYSYTSGTTGAPKCIVYKEESATLRECYVY